MAYQTIMNSFAKHLFFAIVFGLMLSIPSVKSLGQDSIPSDFCISSEEYKLYQLITEYRKAMNLDAIPLSKSLCYVAKTHVIDLITNNPDTNTCNFHSWSDKGDWTACCFEKEIKDKSCMLNKAREITLYPGSAYEIIYWENKSADAEKAFNQWRETSVARSLITNFKNWETFDWYAMGVGIQGGFAIAWFGEEPDVEAMVSVCGTTIQVENKPDESKKLNEIIGAETGRFYIIFGSFKTLEDAKVQMKIYQNEGFRKAKIVSKDNKYRISLSDYSSQELAAQAKKELPGKFKGAWILPW